MIRLSLILTSFLFLVSCADSGSSGTATGGGGTVSPGINNDILSYVQEFDNTFNSKIIADELFPVQFDGDGSTGGTNDLGTTVGVCRVWSDGSREVLLNKSWWNAQDDVSRKVLVFHELGHCYFNRNHESTMQMVDNDPNVKMPKSMMYPVINPIVFWYKQGMPYKNYDSFADYYNKELSGSLQAMTYSPLADNSYMTYEEEHVHSDEELEDNDGCVQYMDIPNPNLAAPISE